MRNISTELEAHFSSGCTSLATCWKLMRKDGTVMGFTDHDQDIVFDSITYDPYQALIPLPLKIKPI